MHPAYSVLFFTCASGAGYGLLIWLAGLGALGLVPDGTVFNVIGLGLALALITFGLLSSTYHLGRPERAWRAFSQWRTSWLSREGVAAVATYVPAGAMGLGVLFGAQDKAWWSLAAWLSAAGALATVWCTGQIYATLKTIRAWSRPIVPPLYVVLALATGAVLLCLLLAVFGALGTVHVWLAAAFLALAWVMKAAYWTGIDSERRALTAGDATGLGRFGGVVRQVEAPHTQANYVMREMGYHVARKHAERLRQLAVLLTFLLPILGVFVALILGPPMDLVLLIVATASAVCGVLVERWLFFAEAEHVSMLYYGSKAA